MFRGSEDCINVVDNDVNEPKINVTDAVCENLPYGPEIVL
jgi:hypothetical protein